MTDTDKYLFLEITLTCLLLFIVMSLFGKVSSSYILYLIFTLSLGLCLIWLIPDKNNQTIGYLVTICVLVIFIWIAYSILNSSFLYKDVVLICIKGLIFLEIILCLNIYSQQYLTYMQVLSIPLFMCFPAAVKGDEGMLIMPILLYFICWLIILRLKFYEFIKKPISEIDLKKNYSITLIAIIFVIGLLFSRALFLGFPLGKIKEGGIFQEEFVSIVESDSDRLDKEYYNLQDKLIKQITDFISILRRTEDKYEVLGLLDYLIKDASNIEEVKRAEQGLVSYLRTPGLGLEKGEGEEVVITLKSYVDKKISFNLRRIEESESSFLDNRVKAELPEALKELKEWKDYAADFKQTERGTSEVKTAVVVPENLKEYSEEKIDIDVGVVKLPTQWMAIMFRIFAFMLMGIAALFVICYLFTKSQANKLSYIFRNPREFIINLYENAKVILIIFGLKYEGVLVPVSYAELIERRYSIKDNLFLRFTEKFEEAKYSSHVLRPEDAHSTLDYYNNFLKELFSNYNKLSLFFKYCLTLLKRRPLSIYRS